MNEQNDNKLTITSKIKKQVKLVINSVGVKQVDSFCCLGTIMTYDNHYEDDITKR